MHQDSGVWAGGTMGVCMQCARGAGGRGVPNRARRLLTVHAEVLCMCVSISLLTVVSCADSWTFLGGRRRLRRGATSVQSCGI